MAFREAVVLEPEANQLLNEIAIHWRPIIRLIVSAIPVNQVFTRDSADGILCPDMRDAPPATCALCSKEVAPGARAVYATVENENPERVYHLDCFVVFTTGSRAGTIWTYRIVGTRAEEEP